MLLDSELLFSDDQAFTATAASTNELDLTAADMGQGNPLTVFVKVTEAFAGLTSVTFALQASATSGSGHATVITTGAVALADLTLGAEIPIGTIPYKCAQYVRMNYTVAGTGTAGKITSGIKLGTPADDALTVVPAGT
jgi:hypothetical protein